MLTECARSEHHGALAFMGMLDVRAFRVRDQRVVKLVSVGIMDDMVGLNEILPLHCRYIAVTLPLHLH